MKHEMFDPIPTRASLLERLKNWDSQTSWQEFFDAYWRLLYSVALQAGLTDTEAQEVVQETLVAVARKINGFKTDPNRGSFSAWLMRLTRGRIADQFRKRRSAKRPILARDVLAPSLDETGSSSDPLNRFADPVHDQMETLWSREWQKNLMARALERVKRQVSAWQYQIFDLHVLQGLTAPDTARTVQVSIASVYMAKSRVSRLLKQAMKAVRRESD